MCTQRVPGLSIRDCAGTSVIRGPSSPKLCRGEIHVTAKAVCESLVLVLVARGLAQFVTMPWAPTPPMLNVQLLLDSPKPVFLLKNSLF